MNLNPCPHCHKTQQDRWHDREIIKLTYQDESRGYSVMCCWCAMAGPLFGTEDEAAEAWNNLPRNQSQPNQISESKSI